MGTASLRPARRPDDGQLPARRNQARARVRTSAGAGGWTRRRSTPSGSARCRGDGPGGRRPSSPAAAAAVLGPGRARRPWRRRGHVAQTDRGSSQLSPRSQLATQGPPRSSRFTIFSVGRLLVRRFLGSPSCRCLPVESGGMAQAVMASPWPTSQKRWRTIAGDSPATATGCSARASRPTTPCRRQCCGPAVVGPVPGPLVGPVLAVPDRDERVLHIFAGASAVPGPWRSTRPARRTIRSWATCSGAQWVSPLADDRILPSTPTRRRSSRPGTPSGWRSSPRCSTSAPAARGTGLCEVLASRPPRWRSCSARACPR